MIRLGLPSKGRLMEQCADWFAERGIGIERSGAEREYAGQVTGIDGVVPVFLSAGEIPRELAAGRIDFGVTGADMVQENLAFWESRVAAVAGLGFGRADLVVAVPKAWVDVTTADDLDAVAAAFRARHGHRLRIATKYHRLMRAWIRAREIADVQLVDSQGATEGTVAQGTAEAIADITTTGATLDANHLRPLDEEPVLRSEAMLFRSRASAADGAALIARLGLPA
jgi:ATP phosphoribosyltransferase